MSILRCVAPLLAMALCTCTFPTPIERSCGRLVDEWNAWLVRAGAANSVVDRDPWVKSCVGLAALPGSLATVDDIERCRAQIAISDSKTRPPCFGVDWNLFSNDHLPKGRLSPGQSCRANHQCASGHCEGSDSDTCGTCLNPRQLGERCTTGVDLCKQSLCRDGVCEPYGQRLGEECQADSRPCQKALYCRESRCASRFPDGQACDHPDACPQGSGCHGGVCIPLVPNGQPCPDPAVNDCAEACVSGLCLPRRLGLGLGEVCTGNDCDASADLICSVSYRSPPPGQCVKRSGRGEPCPPGCQSGLTCDPGTFESLDHAVCVDYPPVGMPCTHYGFCAAGAICLGNDYATRTTGICMRPGREGDSCPCGAHLICVQGRCALIGEHYDCK